jgi:hypothetical protein
VIPGQRKLRLDPGQTMEMLKAAEQSPSEKSAHIQTIFDSMGFDKEPTLKAWGTAVSNKLVTVGAARCCLGGCWGVACRCCCRCQQYPQLAAGTRIRAWAHPHTPPLPAQVDARVLPQPALAYGRPAAMDVGTRGAWNLRNAAFVRGAELNCWAVLSLVPQGRVDVQVGRPPLGLLRRWGCCAAGGAGCWGCCAGCLGGGGADGSCWWLFGE